MSSPEELNYDFNYNMFIAKSLIMNLENQGDRIKVTKWLKRLTTCNKSIEEMKLRNDFMYYLVLNIQNGELRPPFENDPVGPLPQLATLLPGGTTAAAGLDDSNEFMDDKQKEKSLLYKFSPDGGAFLSSQPIPRCGAFCYMAVVSRSPKKN